MTPRRNQLDQNTPAELAIREAIQAVERAGAHPLLTEAVCLLQSAKERVADFVDGVGLESERVDECESLTVAISAPAAPRFAFLAPGVSGSTDSLQEAHGWLRRERARFPETGAQGAIYARIDLAANPSPLLSPQDRRQKEE